MRRTAADATDVPVRSGAGRPACSAIRSEVDETESGRACPRVISRHGPRSLPSDQRHASAHSARRPSPTAECVSIPCSHSSSERTRRTCARTQLHALVRASLPPQKLGVL
jgi:hypothetical protein